MSEPGDESGAPEREPQPQQAVAQAAGQTGVGAAALAGGAAAPNGAEPGDPRPDRSTLFWALGVVLLLALELYFYGMNGWLRVCVAKEGFHDFNLIGQSRTDENRWKFPFCEDRSNLGLRSEFDELARDAVKAACRRATLMHFRNETDACIATEKNWRRKVFTRQVMPWERPFYRRLFWLDR